ncbi:MAG TPA: hypothetical protein VMS76_09390 [Planctomycetota bacterium]|nr:hypothetical protein [Planctomycetota bacterium]
MHLAITLNSEPVKYAIILLTAPFWLPFVKALWRELNDSLREEGGLLGQAPTPKELAEMNRELGAHESSLVSERWEDIGRGNRPAARARGAGRERPHGFGPGGR